MSKLTFIGAGNIGGATAIGLVKGGAVAASDVTVTARHEQSLEKFKALGMKISLDNNAAVKDADIIFFAVKPWQMEEVVLALRSSLDLSRQLIVSIAPGISADKWKNWLTIDGKTAEIAYVIPNTAMEICQSMTFISPVTCNPDHTNALKEMFQKTGECLVVPVSLMMAGTSIASCGIAYAMRFVTAASKAGVELGLDPYNITSVVCQTMKGAAELIMANESDPEDEIKKVTTPGGLTFRGLAAMEKAGFTKSVAKAVLAVKNNRQRIVVKVGSNVLTDSQGNPDSVMLENITAQIAQMQKMGYDVVLVSSGAVTFGRSMMEQNPMLSDVQQRQLYSSMGQTRLMDCYYECFKKHSLNVGQILAQKGNFTSGMEYSNLSNCVETLLKSGVIPIINENDTVSIKELMFTDNDELSSLVAQMVDARNLVILSNIDGLYTGRPDDPQSKLIPVVKAGEDFSGYISDSKSEFGRGGMSSKCHVASKCAAAGIKVMIANGKRENVLVNLFTSPESVPHTEFLTE